MRELKLSKRPIVLSAVLAVAALAVLCSSFDATAGAAAKSRAILGRATLTAHAAFHASKREAQEQFFVTVAACLNDPEEDLSDCIDAAEAEVSADIAHAMTQFDARLAIIALVGDGPYDPEIEPANFTANVTNPYFPLVPGRTLVYEKTTPEGLERVEVTVLATTVTIDDVECRAVRDVVTLDGVLKEDTTDWFAQDTSGNVWYFGEISLNYDDDGFLESIDGSWRADVEGAKPGIVMPAAPAVGDAYRMEFLFNEAEDFARVIGVGESAPTPLGVYAGCVKTEDSTPLEPGHIEHKFYAPGIGLVLEVDPVTSEALALVQIIN